MKNYRTEITAAAFLALLMLGVLLMAPWRTPLSAQPTADSNPSPTEAATPAKPPSAAETPAAPGNGTFPLCANVTSGLCLASVGTDALSGETVFSLNIRNSNLSDLYLLVSTAITNRYNCQFVQSLPEILYCNGPFIPGGTQVNIEVYTHAEDRLILTGTLILAEDTPPPPGSTPPPTYPPYPSYP